MFGLRAKNCIRCKKCFQTIEQKLSLFRFVTYTFLNLFRLCRIFSCLDFIEFCHVWNTYVHRIFMKILYLSQYYIVFFHCKTNKLLYRHLANTHHFLISIKAISILRVKITLKINTFQTYIQAEKIL